MTRRAIALCRALPSSTGPFAVTVLDLVAAYARIQNRTDWRAFVDPIGD